MGSITVFFRSFRGIGNAFISSVLLLILVLVSTGCVKIDELRQRYTPQSPRAVYEFGLKTSGLRQSALGIAWFEAGDRALLEPVSPTVPYRETGYVDPARPHAAAFRIQLTRGQRFLASVSFSAPDSGSIFLDLFRKMDRLGLGTRQVATADSTQSIRFDADRTGTYILRLQPELLAGGRYELTVRTAASVVFPVSGFDSGAIQSGFGDSRDGGRRSHHGVDIFAPRGTPVIAATSGFVSSTRTGGLGGKTVWLRSAQTGASIYYAHLQEQLVRRGTRVAAGDTLGLVGNSGNARTTPPHLHFGIYRNGPVDPHPYIYEPDQPMPRIAVEAVTSSFWMRTRIDDSGIYASPTQRSGRIQLLERYTSVHVMAAAASYYRVQLPDGTTGYIRGNQIEPETEPIEEFVLASSTPIQSIPSETAGAMGIEPPGKPILIRSRFGDYLRVTTDSGQTGWLLDI
ncbi:MAG: M23 family metallopeptidase [Bacteroidetes bacterium]|nr:M23 family metallopeptidase [Bacteroidota bacterium]